MNGRAGERDLRTSFEVQLVVGLPLAQHNLEPFVVSPFRFSWDTDRVSDGECREETSEESALRHPICKVLGWEQRMKNEATLNRSQIAQIEGLTKSRVTQMFRLLNLPKDAQRYLAELKTQKAIEAYSLRGLFAVAKLPKDQRTVAFEAMKATAVRSGCDKS